MSFQKVTLQRPTKNTPKSKILKQIRVILGLAKIQAYDEVGRIRDSKGNFLPNSDIVTLLNNAMTPGRVLTGQDVFISLLKEAKIPPELITNDNVRAKLTGLTTQIQTETIDDPQIHVQLAERERHVTKPKQTTEPQRYATKRSHEIEPEIPSKMSRHELTESAPPVLQREDLKPILKRRRDESPPRLERENDQETYKRTKPIPSWEVPD